MKICIFGAGAVGGVFGALLTRAGADVTLVARGAHLEAMRSKGLTVVSPEERFAVKPRCSDDPREIGPQDYVIATLKAHSLGPALPGLLPLLGPDTALVSAQNGIPWWYGYKLGGPFDGRQLESVDPGGKIWRQVTPQRAIGAVVWQAATMLEPGVVEIGRIGRLTLGEPDGSDSDRVGALSEILSAGGIGAPVLDRIRDDIWLKLWGNLSFNPLSVLTDATLQALAENPDSHQVLLAMMEEAEAIGRKLGVTFTVGAAERIAMGGRVGPHRSSMLQDLDAGRPLELDALLGAVLELADWVDLPAPTLALVYRLVRCRAAQQGD